MNETPQFRCGDPEALVTYAYDECLPEERLAMDAHLVTCASCTEEILALRGTRAHLAEWTPPEVHLGFRVTNAPISDAAAAEARILRPAKWWSRPLPAWAQAAAAAAIFTAGLAIGGARQVPAARPTDVARTATQPQPVSLIAPATVSRDDLDSLEQRLRGEIALTRGNAQSRTSRSSDELLVQMRALIADSERRQQQFIVAKTVQVATQLEERHRADLVQVQQAMGEIENVAGASMRNTDQLGRFIGAPTGGVRVRMVNTTTGR
jgi:hypothetical protein